jgi:hypothetical protein
LIRAGWRGASFGLSGPAFGYDDDRDPVLLPAITAAG